MLAAGDDDEVYDKKPQRYAAEDNRTASNYRATHMHSADYAVASCLSVRPSVRHTPVLCVNGYTYPQSFFAIG